ncbi:hypothetical protein DMP17_44330 [Pseudonocardia sp. TMWB2A]
METEAGTRAADCGTLVVPEKRGNPGSALIALPVLRIRSTSPRPAEPVFRLGGGPGLSNLEFPEASRFLEHRDVVLVGYRGVDGSRRLDCPEVATVMLSREGLTAPQTLLDTARAFELCSTRLRDDGVDLTGYSVAERVDDLEAARTALDYPVVDLLSSSAGTRTALAYSWRHPAAVARSVMISVNPPGHMFWDPRVTDAQFAQYGELCRRDPFCFQRTPDLVAALRDSTAHLPTGWGPLTIKSTNVRILGQYGMHYNGAQSAPTNAATTLDALTSGDPGALWAMSVLADLALPGSNVWGEFASYASLDAPDVAAYYAAGGDPGSILGNASTDFLWGGPQGWSSSWPQDPLNAEYRRTRPSEVETLLVSGGLDFSTPPHNATADLLPLLPRGHQVVLPGLGHTTDIWAQQPDAARHLVNTFFDTGGVDASRFVDRAPDFTAIPVSMSTAARLLVGIPLGLLALGALLLVALARRRNTAARTRTWVRATIWLPLGLAGWSFGVLLTWTVFPGDSVLSATAVLPGVALFIALGAALTEPSPTTSTPARPGLSVTIALPAAVLGGLLGLQASATPAAPLLAVLGTAAATHLALTAGRVLTDRQRTDRSLGRRPRRQADLPSGRG